MLILAFDTTGPEGGAALYREGQTLGEVRSDGGANYSVALFEMVGRLLSDAGFGLADVGLFAAATGPGSFTGIRVGLAAAQGWACAFDRPVCGVSVLEAMAESARPPGEIAVPLLDARRGEFYLGVYCRTPGGAAVDAAGAFALSGEGLVLPAGQIAALVTELMAGAQAGVTLVVREHDVAARALAGQLPAACLWRTVSGFLAGAIARVAWRAASSGRLQQPRELDAWYIRRSDAEVNWRG